MKIMLFCLPYARGNCSMFYRWKNCLHKSIELCPVELAGRGEKVEKTFYESMDEAVEDVYMQIERHLDIYPDAVIGHSMGSIVAFELSHKISKMWNSLPLHAFFSGHAAPYIKRNEDYTYTLNDRKFKEKIVEMGGTSREFIEDKILHNYFLPILRADFKLVETYEYRDRDNKYA